MLEGPEPAEELSEEEDFDEDTSEPHSPLPSFRGDSRRKVSFVNFHESIREVTMTSSRAGKQRPEVAPANEKEGDIMKLSLWIATLACMHVGDDLMRCDHSCVHAYGR